MEKFLFIGIDGLPYSLLKSLMDKGIMKNVASLAADSLFSEVSSSLPEVSSVSWSSIITGKGPEYHNIFGFVGLMPGAYNIFFPNFNSLKEKAFWEKEGSGKSVVINVPSTFPPKEMNGIHISGFVSLDLERSVYPKNHICFLKSIGYKIDADVQKAYVSLDIFFKELFDVLEARWTAIRYFLHNEDWDNFFAVFTGTDRLMHFLWDAWENEGSKYHNDFLNYFRRLDEIIGSILEVVGDKDDMNVVLASDHGFERLDKSISVNRILIEGGFLTDKFAESGYKSVDRESVAFAIEPSSIYINSKSKYTNGLQLSESDMSKIKKDLKSLFAEVEIDGKKIVGDIFFKEDIYDRHAPYYDNAPDLVLVGNKYINLTSTPRLAGFLCNENEIFTGKHTWHDTFLIVNNCNKKISEKNFPVFRFWELLR